MTLTRRALLEQVGAVGGIGAAYTAMEILGLAVPTPGGAENFTLPQGSGNGRSVVILGAGIAGLVSAYELRRAGYRVTVLEARDRIGGRSWTIRGGDRIVQAGRPDQVASFAPGLYFNAGPARIPSTHRLILGYARRFGVQLEPFVNSNRSAGWDFGGKVLPERRMVEDMRGLLAELLAKAIDTHALDAVAPKEELAMIREFLGFYAGVGPKGNYVPNGSSGYSVDGGAYNQAPVPLPPLGFKELVPSQAVGLPYVFEHIWDMQATMLQPVGGMDRIAHAIYDQVRPSVRLKTPITAIRRSGDRVRIEHGPGAQMTEADYCICTIPVPVLARIPNDFSPAKKAVLAAGVPYVRSVKLAFEAPRFWEADDNIFGGLAWTDRANENVIYPSGGIGSSRGVIVGAYCAGWTRQDNPGAFEAMSHEQRARVSRDSIEALHPGRSHLLGKPATVAWGLTPYSEGVGANWPDRTGAPGERGPGYQELLKPEGPIVFAGEHLSYQPTWQEGAALSAHAAMKLVQAMAAEKHLAPDGSAGAASEAALEASALRCTGDRPMRRIAASAVALALLATPILARPAAPVPSIAAAVAAPGRSADNVKLDEGRKPAQVLQFLGLRPGMQVLDLFGGNRYWSEIMAPAVGPKGSVTVWEPAQFFKPDTKAAFDAFKAKQPNVSIVVTPFEAPELPKNRFDFVILNDNYHDTYWQNRKMGLPRMEPAAFLKVVHDAMKPGAVIGVIDHVANPNPDTRATVDKLHRIDPNVVKADFQRAGFVLVGTSNLLRNPVDDHSLLVFDPKVRGHTDRFIFKFKKRA